MKLRLREDSIRLRLTQSEVRRLVEAGIIEERTRLGPTAEHELAYALALTDDGPTITCSFADRRIAVLVPRSIAREWAPAAGLGLEATQVVADGATLRILVEKDLACLTPRAGEDDRDAYPNPKSCSSQT